MYLWLRVSVCKCSFIIRPKALWLKSWYMHAYTEICVFVFMLPCIHSYKRWWVHNHTQRTVWVIFVRKGLCIHASMYASCSYVSVHVCTHACMYASMHVCMYVYTTVCIFMDVRSILYVCISTRCIWCMHLQHVLLLQCRSIPFRDSHILCKLQFVLHSHDKMQALLILQ
jgi:hypothetical protein